MDIVPVDRQAPPPPYSQWSSCETKQHCGGSWLGESQVVGFEDSRQAGAGCSIVHKELEHGVLSPAWEHLLLIVPRRPRGVPQCAHLAKLQCLGVHFWPVSSSPSHEECVSFGVCLCHIPLNTS